MTLDLSTCLDRSGFNGLVLLGRDTAFKILPAKGQPGADRRCNEQNGSHIYNIGIPLRFVCKTCDAL